MRARLEDVWPDVVHEVGEGVLAAEAEHAQRHVLHRRARRLPVHQVAEKAKIQGVYSGRGPGLG